MHSVSLFLLSILQMLSCFLNSEIYVGNLEKTYILSGSYWIAVILLHVLQKELFYINWCGYSQNICFIILLRSCTMWTLLWSCSTTSILEAHSALDLLRTQNSSSQRSVRFFLISPSLSISASLSILSSSSSFSIQSFFEHLFSVL